MAEERTDLEHLEEVGFDHLGRHAAGGVVAVHVFLEVVFEELEHQMQFVLAVHHVLELNNVRMLQLLEQRDFSDRSRRHALVLSVQTDLFQGNDALSLFIPRFIHHAIRSLPDLFDFQVLIHFESVEERLSELTVQMHGSGRA